MIDLRHGDNLAVLPTLPDNSVDAIVTDPPYGLGFMGRTWDATVPVHIWTECLRVLRPGGHLLAFGGTRTWHRQAVAIEDAGFEIRDSIACWMHGQGFPKGKGQLKPAHEPIVVARKRAPGPWLNVDACRVGGAWENPSAGKGAGRATANANGSAYGKGAGGIVADPHPAGRWPANVVLTHGEDCTDVCVDGCPVAELDAQTPNLHTQDPATRRSAKASGGQLWDTPGMSACYGDQGGASRFFPTFRYQAKAPTSERPRIDGQGWPTVKPLALMRWLVRLVTPPGGLVLDPFAGTGATLQAAELEGFDSLGVELDPFAYQLACQRLGIEKCA